MIVTVKITIIIVEMIVIMITIMILIMIVILNKIKHTLSHLVRTQRLAGLTQHWPSTDPALTQHWPSTDRDSASPRDVWRRESPWPPVLIWCSNCLTAVWCVCADCGNHRQTSDPSTCLWSAIDIGIQSLCTGLQVLYIAIPVTYIRFIAVTYRWFIAVAYLYIYDSIMWPIYVTYICDLRLWLTFVIYTRRIYELPEFVSVTWDLQKAVT